MGGLTTVVSRGRAGICRLRKGCPLARLLELATETCLHLEVRQS